MNKSISEVMLEDHKRIEDKFKELKESNKSNFKERFKNFRFELEKHFVVEENAILKSYNPEKYNYEIVQKTIKEHKEILDIIKRMGKQLEQEESVGMVVFEDMLMKHRNFEDEVLYPRLDKELNPKQKDEIIKKIKMVEKELK